MPDNDTNVQDSVQNNSDMLDENDLVVPRGFLISLDSNANYVPFFVKVRDDDIIYSDVLNSNVYESIITRFDSLGMSYGHRFVGSTKELEIKKDSWTFYIKPDGTFRASYIKNTGFVNWFERHILNDRTNYITAEIPIPLPVKQTAESPALFGSFTPKTLNNQSELLATRLEPINDINTAFGLSNVNNKPYYTTVNLKITCLDSMLIDRGVSLTDGTMNQYIGYIEDDCFTLNIQLQGQLDLNVFGITE